MGGGRAESTIVNYGIKVPTLDAAFVNATVGQGCELDDVGFAAGVIQARLRCPSPSLFAINSAARAKIFLPRWWVAATSCIGS